MDLKRCGHSPYFQEKKDTKIECTDTDITKKESHEMSLTQRLIGNFKQSPYFRNKKNVKIEYDNNQTVKEENSEAPVETMVKKELRVELIPDLRGNHSKISGSRVPMPESSAIKSELLRPDNWETVLENIRTMRTKQDAPVDQLVAEHLSNKDCPPEVRRFQVLVTLMLSTQTKDQVTFAAMQRLKQHGLTCSNINETEEAEIARLIHPVGFWKRKASYIKRTAAILAEQYNGDIPKTVKEMCRLPGVGEKVAFITVDTAWHNNIGIGVDTHVHRITNRLGWTLKATKTPEKTREALEDWFPRPLWSELNVLLVGFGQQQCTPVKPKCSTCLNQNLCPFGKTQPLKKKH